MYLGTIYLSTKFRQIRLQLWPPGGHLGNKNKSAITPELMAGSAPNFYHRYESNNKSYRYT
jgi:hypothetical protein